MTRTLAALVVFGPATLAIAQMSSTASAPPAESVPSQAPAARDSFVLKAPPVEADNPAQSLSEDVYTSAVVIMGGVLLLGFGVACLELRDLQRKREDEATHLQAQIGDALLRDKTLAKLPIAPTVHIPLRRRAAATVELHGQVPTVELRQAALSVANQETSRSLSTYRIRDYMQIAAPMGAHAA